MNAFVVSGLVSAEAAFWRGGPSDKLLGGLLRSRALNQGGSDEGPCHRNNLAKRDGGGACARAGQQAAGGLLGGSFSRTRSLTSLTFEGQQMHWGDLDIDQDQIV
jgi:hypothetical protein